MIMNGNMYIFLCRVPKIPNYEMKCTYSLNNQQTSETIGKQTIFDHNQLFVSDRCPGNLRAVTAAIYLFVK